MFKKPSSIPLPRSSSFNGAPSRLAMPLHHEAKASLQVPHILLVDDDRSVRESLRRVLAAQGWEVAAANGGIEALEYLRGREPDLIITDLRMDAVSGWDLLFHESLQRPHLPIFVITALTRHTAAGADKFATEFFEKPLDLHELLEAVRRHVPACHGVPSPP